MSIKFLNTAFVGQSLQRASHASLWPCSMDVDLSEQLRPRQQEHLPQATYSGAASGEAWAVRARVYMAARVALHKCAHLSHLLGVPMAQRAQAGLVQGNESLALPDVQEDCCTARVTHC